MSIYSKLFEIQQNLKAGKGQYNKFGNFHYRSCEDILEAVKSILAQQKARKQIRGRRVTFLKFETF